MNRARPFLRPPALLFAALVAAVLSAAVRAEEKEPPRLTEKIRRLIQSKYTPAIEAKNWDEALVVINGALPGVDPDSYDAALLYEIKGDLSVQKNRIKDAAQAYERSLEISDRHQFFDSRVTNELILRIAQFNFSEAAGSKEGQDPKAQAEGFAKAERYTRRWLDATKGAPVKEQMAEFITSLYVNYAFFKGGGDQADRAYIQEGLKWTEYGLQLGAHPRPSFYRYKLTCLAQLDRAVDVVDMLELLAADAPAEKMYGSQLYYNYLRLAAMAQENGDEKNAFAYNVRAILTIERAQKHGYLNSPQDNFGLVSIYFTIDQYDQAAKQLAKGLRDGGIESTLNNWKLLAFAYKKIRREKLAIEALKDATKVFPDSGQLEYEIALIYWDLERPDQAYKHAKACVAKGSTEKPPGAGWYFYAMLAYQLGLFDEAATAAEKAATFPENAGQITQLQEAIKGSLQERENKLNRAQNNL